MSITHLLVAFALALNVTARPHQLQKTLKTLLYKFKQQKTTVSHKNFNEIVPEVICERRLFFNHSLDFLKLNDSHPFPFVGNHQFCLSSSDKFHKAVFRMD